MNAGFFSRCHLSCWGLDLVLDTQDWDYDPFFISNTGKKLYQDSYINVVTESHIRGSVMFSEKIWKAVMNLQPFVVVGQPGYLRELRRRGFRTWSWFVDESYDDIVDCDERVDVVCREINRLLSLSLTCIRDLYIESWDDLIHNYRLFRKTVNTIPPLLRVTV